jgi:hypothetical protein
MATPSLDVVDRAVHSTCRLAAWSFSSKAGATGVKQLSPSLMPLALPLVFHLGQQQISNGQRTAVAAAE